MARRTRFFLNGSTYHVMFRGNNGQSIFSAASDCREFCLLLKEGAERYGHRILAFCFMTNHVHLAIQLKDISLSKICQNICFRYTRFYHYKYETTGHLFQGRFKSILVDDQIYLKELVRYIHLNPVRAQMVSNPLNYLWSSHQAYLTNQESSWFDKNRVLEIFGGTSLEAKEAFHQFVTSGIGVKENIDFESGFSDGIIGSDMFIEEHKMEIEELKSEVMDLKALIDNVAEWYKIDIKDLQGPKIARKFSHIRAMIALLVRNVGLNLRELSTFFDQTDSAMSQAALRLEEKMKISSELKNEFNILKEVL